MNPIIQRALDEYPMVKPLKKIEFGRIRFTDVVGSCQKPVSITTTPYGDGFEVGSDLTVDEIKDLIRFLEEALKRTEQPASYAHFQDVESGIEEEDARIEGDPFRCN